MALEVAVGVAAVYGVVSFIRDARNYLNQRSFNKAERRAAKQYDLVPVKGNPGLYEDRGTGYTTRMEYENGEFYPSSVTDFQIQITGRHYDFRR